MTWIDVAWTLMASASLTVGFIHLIIWFKQRSQYAYLLFFALAASVAIFGVFELSAVRAQTPGEYATAVRWAQVPITGVLLSILGFVRLYFDAGRLWLAYAAGGLRLLALVLSFVTGASVQLLDVTGLAYVTLWGGAVVSAPIGTLNPWIAVAQMSNVFLVAFVVDASITLWCRGGPVARRRVALVGGGLVLCITFAAVLGALVMAGLLHMPTVLTPCFLVVVLAMGYELGWDVVHAAQLSAQLRESERRMELAAQAAELAFWSWDIPRDEIWTTPKGRALFEFAESKRIDLDATLRRVHPNDREAVRGALQNALRAGGVLEREFRLALPSGSVRWIAARGQVELNRAGKPTLLRGVALDVTDRVRAEHEVAQHRSELAHLSRVATLSALAGSLAHEINQPLTGILANAEAAQSLVEGKDAQSSELRDILADIVEDDKRAGEVIRRLRTLLRKGEVQRGPIDVNKVVDEVLQLTRNDLLNRGVVASSDLAGDLPPVLGDRIQMQQVLLNLIVNACDSMEGASEPRQLRVSTRIANGSGLEVVVSDSGPGIAPADLERIFEPFVTTKEHGMGLGLSVCRTIIAAHDGRLWAEANGGKGATFRFTLPVLSELQ
jgi:signal transduction histidine kinase